MNNQKAKSEGIDIFEKSIESLGERQTASNIMSIVGIADCTSPKGTYTTELYSTRNDRLLFKQIRPERDTFVAIINGSYAWSIDPITHQVESLDIKSIAMIQGHDFLMLPFILAQRFKNPEIEHITTFTGKQCTKVSAIDKFDLPCDLYFDADTHRLRGIVLANPIGRKGETVQIIFTSWQQFDKITLPVTITITDTSGDFFFVFREPILNSLDESIFAIPNKIKAA